MSNLVNKDDILDSYFVSSERLISLIDRENYLLSNYQISKIAELSEEKETLVSEIEGFRRILLSDKSYISNISQAQKNVLINTTERLSKTAAKNKREMEVAMTVNHMVLEAIHNVVAHSQNQAEVYSSKGVHAAYTKNITPIKFDQSI